MKTSTEIFRPTADPAIEYLQKRFHLNIVGSIVNNMTGTTARVELPQVTLETSDPRNTEVIEFNVAKMTFPDVPEKNELTNVVVWSLAKCAGARHCATAIVKPIASETPIRVI